MRRTAVIAALVIGILPSAAHARTIRVHAGQSIQAAVDRARAGDTIRVAKGTYRERGRRCITDRKKRCAVVVRKPDISLIAARGTVLRAKRRQYQGIAVGKPAGHTCMKRASRRLHGSLVSGFTVRGFSHDGVFLICVDHWRITGVHAIDNGEYGLFPSHTVRGRADHSFASGSDDTGIYIGQSRQARVDNNRAQANVSGFEIENSTGVVLERNVARGNTAGILSFALPKLDVKRNRSNTIEHNTVGANNKANTCVDPDDTVCRVPPGTGILLVAADRNVVRANTVGANRSFGITVANYCVAFGSSEAECKALDIEPSSDANRVSLNAALGNGYDPDPSVPSFAAADLAWDLQGKGNCWASNLAGKVFPDPLPACG